MKRLAALVLALMSLALPAHGVTAPVVVAQQAQDGPAVVIDDSEAIPADEAWTFRYLVPTLMALVLVLVVGLFVWYQRAVSGRYRVTE